jgi:hypothetical protein
MPRAGREQTDPWNAIQVEPLKDDVSYSRSTWWAGIVDSVIACGSRAIEDRNLQLFSMLLADRDESRPSLGFLIRPHGHGRVVAEVARIDAHFPSTEAD